MNRRIGQGRRTPGAGKTAGADAGPSVPSQRALDALAEAVRRAREATGAAGAAGGAGAAGVAGAAGAGVAGAAGAGEAAGASTTRHYPTPPTPSLAVTGGPLSRFDSIRPRRGRFRRLAPLAMVLGVLVAAAAVTLTVVGGSHPSHPAAVGPKSGHTGTSKAPVTTPSTTLSPSTSSQPAPTPSTTTLPVVVPTTTATTVPAGTQVPVPQLSSITPSQGGPGTVVVVHGTDLFSPNGLVLGRFDGQPTRTTCPTQTSCNVTVPPLPGSPTDVRVTITTESGTSNALSFFYR